MLLLYSRVGKNRDTSGGPRREPGQAVAPATKTASLVAQLSRHGAAIAYTDLLCRRALLIFEMFYSNFFKQPRICYWFG